MKNQTVSLAVMDALGRLGIAHDIMELETNERTRPWQEGLVRLALRQGKNLTEEERKTLEEFLQGGRTMNTRIFWGWQWAYGLGCHQQLCDGALMPCGNLVAFGSKKERDSWLECGTWRVAKTRGEAMKLLRKGWTGNSAFDEEVARRKMDGETPLSDKELLELWKQVEDEEL